MNNSPVLYAVGLGLELADVRGGGTGGGGHVDVASEELAECFGLSEREVNRLRPAKARNEQDVYSVGWLEEMILGDSRLGSERVGMRRGAQGCKGVGDDGSMDVEKPNGQKGDTYREF